MTPNNREPDTKKNSAVGTEQSKREVPKYSALFGLAYRHQKENGQWQITMLWGKIFSLLLSIFLVLLVFKTIFIFAFYKYQREYEEMTIKQAILFPLQRTETTTALGDYNIKKAKHLIEISNEKENYYREAFETLLHGVARSRDNIEGKKLLAQFFILMRKQDNAIEALESGIHNRQAFEDLDYVRLYIQLLISKIEDERLINVSKAILSQNPNSAEVKSYVAMALATVYSMHGYYGESEKIIKEYGLDNQTPGLLRLSKNEWEQGNRDEAIDLITKNISRMKDLDPVYALLVNYYILIGDFSKARLYGAMRIASNPRSIVPKIDYLRSLSNSGDKKAADEEIEKLYNSHKSDEKALLHISNYAADTGNLDLMRRIYNNALEKGFNSAQFCMLLLETFIACEKYQEAVKFAEDIISENPKWLDRNEDVFLSLRAVAYYAKGDSYTSTVLVREITRKANVNPRTLVATARRFAILGEKTIAHNLYVSAVERDAKHQYALVRLIQFELESGNSTNLNKYIFRLLNMRRPPRDMIETTRKRLLSDKFIFTEDREKIIAAIDASFELEKVSNNRIFSDLPSDYEDEKILSSFD